MAVADGEPAGLANLYIQPFAKFKHQCLFSIIVASKFRGKGIGTILLETLKGYAKEKFNIEILHLEVYDGNPAAKLCDKMRPLPDVLRFDLHDGAALGHELCVIAPDGL